MNVNWASYDTCNTKTEGTELGGIELQRSSYFFHVGGHVDHLRGQTSCQQRPFGSHVRSLRVAVPYPPKGKKRIARDHLVSRFLFTLNELQGRILIVRRFQG